MEKVEFLEIDAPAVRAGGICWQAWHVRDYSGIRDVEAVHPAICQVKRLIFQFGDWTRQQIGEIPLESPRAHISDHTIGINRDIVAEATQPTRAESRREVRAGGADNRRTLTRFPVETFQFRDGLMTDITR